MKENRTKSFVTEALIISVSNLIVKIIGVVFKIPMSNLLQESMGIFNAAYSIYAMLYMVSTAGLPVAISRIVSQSREKKRSREVARVFSSGTKIFGIVGLVCFVFLYFASDAIAAYSKHADAALAMKVISPTLFLVCVSSAVRGYFQGLKNMTPTAISQLIEAFFKMVIGLAGAYYAKKMNYSPITQAAFGISGLTFGTLLSTIYLLIYKMFSSTKISHPSLECDGYDQIIRRLIRIAVPVTITSSALYFSQFLDTLVINKCLIDSGIAESTAEQLYASYTTLALSLSDLLPSTLVFPIAISILPTVSASVSAGDYKKTKKYINNSVRISGIIALPCAFGLAAVAREAITLIYGAGWGKEIILPSGTFMPIDIATVSLVILAVGIIFISLLSTTNALLQACGLSYLPMISVCLGVIFLVIIEISLVSIPQIGIYGAPIASVVCYIVALAVNMFFLRKKRGVSVSLIKLFRRPFVCAGLCGISAYGTVKLFNHILGPSQQIQGRMYAGISLAVGALVGAIVYAVALILCRGIRKEELCLLPKGYRLAAWLEKKGLM
ncbi:MAG: polysaccharide biosynthesis protein [Clostridia bacterium]